MSHYGRRQGAARAKARLWKVLVKVVFPLEFRSMAPFSTSRYVNGIARRQGNRQLFSLTLGILTLGIGPLTARADDAAFAREGKRS